MTDQTNQEPIDLLPTSGQVDSKAYVYRVTLNNHAPFCITVIATNTTSAKAGLRQQHPNAAITYLGVSERIMQVNG